MESEIISETLKTEINNYLKKVEVEHSSVVTLEVQEVF